MFNKKEINEVCEYADIDNCGVFGYWLDKIFYTIRGFEKFKNISFQDQKEAFLILLKRLLDEGKIVAFPPQEFYKDGVPTVPCRGGVKNYYNPGHDFENIWDVPSDEVIQYIRDHWPEDVTDANDERLNLFWYENYCPRIGWYDEKTDSIIAS